MSSDSWTILSPIEQSIKAKIEAVGTPLRDWDVRINFGIKTGCNEAFIIDGETRDRLIAADPKSAEIIRPILRGRDVKRYGYEFADLYVILAYYGSYKIIPTQYPAVYEHLKSFEDKLRNRGQCRYTSNGKPNLNAEFPGQHHWLELDNNPRKDYMDDFSKQKIMWKRIGSILCFAYDEDGCLGLDSTCFAVTQHAKFITGYLNSLIGNYLLSSSPKTGTGDLLISVQAVAPILAPKGAEAKCKEIIDEILIIANANGPLNEMEEKLDSALFDYFGFDAAERLYITDRTLNYRQ